MESLSGVKDVHNRLRVQSENGGEVHQGQHLTQAGDTSVTGTGSGLGTTGSSGSTGTSGGQGNRSAAGTTGNQTTGTSTAGMGSTGRSREKTEKK